MTEQRWRIPFGALEKAREIAESEDNLNDEIDVLLVGLKLLDWYIQKRNEGWTVMLSRDGEMKEIEIILDN